MHPKSLLTCRNQIMLFIAAAMLLPCALRAQTDGRWSVDADGAWSNSGNWLNGAIADGAGATAYFTNAISASHLVTSDAARTIGNLVFAGSGSSNWTLTNTASFQLSNPSGTATITVSSNTATINPSGAGLSGTISVLKTGVGTLAMAWSNTYSGGTTINQGQVTLNTTAAGQLGTGAVAITNNAVLSLYRGNTTDDGSTIGNFTNAISLPTGQAGTIWCSPRSVTGSAGTASTFTSPVSGGGVLTMRVNGTARGGNAANFSAFTGTLNVTTRTGADNYPVAFAGTTAPGFPNAKVNLAAGVYMYQWLNPPSSGNLTTVQPVGELSGAAGSSLSGNPVSGRFVNWTVGYLNTTATFAGTIRNDTGAAMITKVGTGIWYLSGTNTYTGATLVSTGAIYGVTGGSIANSTITVANGATFGVQVATANAAWTGTNLVLRSGAALAFNYGSTTPSTATAPLNLSGNIAATNPVTVNVYGGSGWVAGGVYPLAKYTTAYVGDGYAAFTLGALPLRLTAVLSNDTANSQIDLVVTTVTEPLRWAVANGNWDMATANWKDAANTSTNYQEQLGLGDQVLFDDSASGTSPITVSVVTNVSPVSVTFSNNSKNYILAGSSNITGSATLTKLGTGTATIQNTNTFTGAVNLNAGILNFTSLSNNLGSGTSINFGGGTLQYAAGTLDDISSRTITFNAGGGTIDDGGNTLTFLKPIGNAGAGGLTKAGAGSLTLNGTNKYSGVTTIANGTLILAANSYISNSTAIVVNSGKVLDVSASGLTLSSFSSQVLAGSGTVSGNVTATNGTTITPGTNNVVGTLTFNNDLTFAGGTYACDISTNSHDLIVVNGNLTLNSGSILTIQASNLTNGVYRLIQYSGSLLSGSGSSANLVVSGFSQAGKVAALSDANANEIDLVVTTLGGASTTWQGNDPSSPNNWDIETTANFTNSAGAAVVFVQGDKPTFDDTAANSTVNLMAALQPGSVTVTADVNNYTFNDGVGGGVGKLTGSGGITKNGASTLTIATANLNSGPTVINGGTLQVGNGGSYGDLGGGNVTNNAALVFNQGGNHVQSGLITGPGSVAQTGSGMLTFTTNNTYTGPTIITAGALQVGNGGASGSLGSGAITNDGNLIINRTGTLSLGGIKTGPNNSGYMTFSGPAAVTFNGGNTYIGNTYISNGVVKLGAAEAIPSTVTQPSSSGWLVLDGSATLAGVLDLNGFNQSVNALSGVAGTVNGVITNSAASGTNTLTVLGSAGTTYWGNINDNTNTSRIALNLFGGNQLELGGANTYSGGTVLSNSATLALHNSAGAGTGGIFMNDGTTLKMNAAGTSKDPSIFPGNVVTIADNATANFTSSQIANGFSTPIAGSSTAVANITGGTTVSFSSNSKQFQNFSGTVLIPSGNTLRMSATTVNNGGDGTTFDVEGSLTTKNGTISMNRLIGYGTVSPPGSNTVTYIIGISNGTSTFNGTIDGTAGFTSTNANLIKSGTGTLTLAGTLNYSGNTTISNGVLAIQTSLNNSPSINLVTNTAQLDVSASGLTLGNSVSQTLSGFGTVIGNLYISSGNGCFVSPGTSGTAGTLTVNGNVTLNSNTTNMVDLTGGLTTPGGGTNDLIKINGDLNLGGGGTVYVRPNFIGSGSVAFGVPYTIIQYTGSLTGDTNNIALDNLNYPHLGAVFSTNTPGAITMTLVGTSNLVWRGDSTNSWQVGVVTNWFDGSSSNFFGQLDKVTFDDTASNSAVMLVGTLTPMSMTVNNTASNYFVGGSGSIGGASGLLKTGSGTITISNTTANTYSGNTVISNGVIQTARGNVLSANSTMEIEAPGLLQLAGVSNSIGGLFGAGGIDNNSAAASTLTIGSGGNGVWSGSISNSGTGGINIVLNGTNDLVVSGANKLNSATASRVNNGTGTLILTNTGSITGVGEFWIGCESAVTGKVVVAGGSLTITNWIVVGRNNTNANGTLIVNSGTVQKTGANNIVVGSLGATGTLTVNGGQVLNNGMLWVGEAPFANATVNLNGGLLQATQVRTNYNGGAPSSSVLNFNGGTLQASAASANFLAVYAANVQNGGLTLDDGGFVISVAQPLLNAGTGGLVKQGAGTVYLDGANTYTGLTMVTNGTLAGIGTIAGPVTVAPAGKLGAGDAAAVGKLTVNNTVNIQGGAVLRINKTGGVKTNDQVVSSSAVSYGGTLVVSNITTDATPLVAGDTFTLFSAASHSGSFTNIAGAPAGFGYTFTNGVLTVITTVATNPTNITMSVSGNSLNLSWPGDHLGWTLQTNASSLADTNAWFPYPGSTTTTNVSIPLDATKTNVFFRLKY